MKGPYIPFDYPDDYTPLDIDRSFTIGRSTTDGTAVQINLGQSTGFIVSGRGGGGTTMLHNLTASLARMPNTLIWHIDICNGSLSAPWLVDEGSAAVDWFAATEEEALRMLDVAVRVAKRRRASYAAEMYRNNQTVLSVLPDRPQIVILIDKDIDLDTLVGRQIDKAMAEMRRVGRAMRVNVVSAYRRATADYMPTEEKKNAEFALVGRVKDAAEVAFALDWDKDYRVPDQRGQFLIGEGGNSIDHFDAFRLTMEQIRRIAVAVAEIRSKTRLDEVSVNAGGEDYLERWIRPYTRQWLALLRGEQTEMPVADVDQLLLEPDVERLDDLINLATELIRKLNRKLSD